MSKLQFIGVDTQYPLANGTISTRTHLDSAASPLAAQVALDTIMALLPHYSNTHSNVHNSAKITTLNFNAAHARVLQFFQADDSVFTSLFMGHGTTAITNRLARGLAQHREQRDCILIGAMEHHANDLPHRKHRRSIHFIPLIGNGANQGTIDLNTLKRLLQKHKVNYLAVSLVSNVTGIVNPIAEICQLAHQYGCYVLVDAAQAAAHHRFYFSDLSENQQPDFFTFSGHKVYCPTAPGVLIAKKSILAKLPPDELGGGIVSEVSYFDYELLPEYPAREEAGTPNIVGAIALASVLHALSNFGVDNIVQHETQLMQTLLEGLKKRGKIQIYGNYHCQRTGAIAFNHSEIDHGLLAAILNDYYGIAVRNGCFCAHPYVSSLLKHALWEIDISHLGEEEQQAYINRKRGMVRVSLGLYNTEEDIEKLLAALDDIEAKLSDYKTHYSAHQDGNYTHRQYALKQNPLSGLL